MGRSPAVVWCEKCEDWQPCRSENASDWGYEARHTGQIIFEDGTRGFRRLRHCDECGEVFSTLEISETDLAARDRVVSDVKKSASKLIKVIAKLS